MSEDSNLLNSVLLTLAYSDQFNFPLTVEEARRRLLGQAASLAEVKQALEKLAVLKLVKKEAGFWSLARGEAELAVRKARAELAAAKMKEVEDLKKIMAWLPWVKAMAVTGSLAVKNLRPGGDLDLLVVTSPRRLWLTRLVVSCLAWLMGRRRTWRGKKKDSWCFNLWLTTDNLQLPLSKRSLYGAYEVCQALFVYDGAGVQAGFYEANQWVKSFLPNYFVELEIDSCPEDIAVGGSLIFDVMDFIAYQAQFWHMYSHMSRELVGRGYAFFHPRLTKNLIYRRWLWALLGNHGGLDLVLVTGVFDLLHREHLRFLRKARAAGDLLLVAIESDQRVRFLKGEGRPLQSAEQRLAQLQALAMVDVAFILSPDFSQERARRKLLVKLKPEILAVSSHTPHLARKRRRMQTAGGVVRVVHEHNSAVSTSLLVAE